MTSVAEFKQEISRLAQARLTLIQQQRSTGVTTGPAQSLNEQLCIAVVEQAVQDGLLDQQNAVALFRKILRETLLEDTIRAGLNQAFS